MTRKYGAKKDANHNDLVKALESGGCYVIDISRLGHGAPDLILGYRKSTYMAEIKNPETSYGRRGLNPNQIAWAKDWPCRNIYMLRNLDDVEKFLKSPEEAEDLIIKECA